jgi:hypothetical protein
MERVEVVLDDQYGMNGHTFSKTVIDACRGGKFHLRR